MPYTRHGHWYGHDDPTHPAPMPVQRCGGLSLCPECAIDAHRGEQGAATVPYNPIYALDPGAGQVTYTTTGANPAGMTTTFTVPTNPPARPMIAAHVHYVSHGTPIREDGTQAYPSVCRAAIVTEINHGDATDSIVGLAVLNPAGLFFHGLADGGCRHDEPVTGKLEGGTWHWSHP